MGQLWLFWLAPLVGAAVLLGIVNFFKRGSVR